MSSDHRSPKDLYDGTASRWVRSGPLSLSDFTGRPPVLALCEPVKGLRVLDLGCGEGYCARKLRQAGAGEVIGIDLSDSMVAAALEQEQREPLGIAYSQGDATDLSRFGDSEFDLVLSMFLFNYLDTEQTRRCMKEIARVVRRGGRFVFSAPHPFLPFVRKSEPPFYFDVGTKGYFTARDGRFPGRIWRRDGVVLDVQLCHKTFQDYFDALALAGFHTAPIVRELYVTPEILEVDPVFFSPLVDTPLHLAMSVTR